MLLIWSHDNYQIKTIEEKNVDASTIIPKKTKTYGYYAHGVISGNVFENT